MEPREDLRITEPPDQRTVAPGRLRINGTLMTFSADPRSTVLDVLREQLGLTETFVVSSFGAVFVEVRIDRELGRIRVSRVVGVYDVGRVINATTTRSQLTGGVIWGIGQALLEGYSYDPLKGMPVNPDFAGYLVPVHADIPADIDISWTDTPDFNFNSVGCRGADEIGITGVSAAIANAVFHATGVRVRDLPITPERVLEGGAPP